MNNHLTYTDITFKDAQKFFGAGLHSLLDKAHANLFGTKVSRTYTSFKDLTHSEADLKFINAHIAYILELIGKHSNNRYGETSTQQHDFFQNHPGDQASFFQYLFIALQKHKQLAIPEAAHLPVPYLYDDYLKLEQLVNKKTVFFTVTGKPVTEKQLYAAGVFYAIGHAFQAVKSNNAMHTSQILVRIQHSFSGPSYLAAYGSKGGRRSGKVKSEKDQAYLLFEEEGIYQKCNGKTASIAEALMPRLKEIGITRSSNTVEKNWVPEFIKRHKDAAMQEKRSIKPAFAP